MKRREDEEQEREQDEEEEERRRAEKIDDAMDPTWKRRTEIHYTH